MDICGIKTDTKAPGILSVRRHICSSYLGQSDELEMWRVNPPSRQILTPLQVQFLLDLVQQQTTQNTKQGFVACQANSLRFPLPAGISASTPHCGVRNSKFDSSRQVLPVQPLGW